MQPWTTATAATQQTEDDKLRKLDVGDIYAHPQDEKALTTAGLVSKETKGGPYQAQRPGKADTGPRDLQKSTNGTCRTISECFPLFP